MKLEIVFTGLIAVALGSGDNPGQTGQPGFKRADSPFDFYLTRANGHVAELLVPIAALNDVPANEGTCKRPDGTRGLCMSEKLEPLACNNGNAVYAVWCLDDTRIELDQRSKKAQFRAGHRKPDPTRQRPFGDRQPGADRKRRQDVSWVPEMSKAIGTGTIIDKPWTKSIVMLNGLRGKLTAYGIPEEQNNQHIWYWCTPGFTGCDPVPGYEQTFASALNLRLKVGDPTIALVTPLQGGTPMRREIALARQPARPIMLLNWPGATSKILPQGARCIADHFLTHFDLVAGHKITRIPWTHVDRPGHCPEPEVDFSGPAGMVQDSFCPPTILEKKP